MSRYQSMNQLKRQTESAQHMNRILFTCMNQQHLPYLFLSSSFFLFLLLSGTFHTLPSPTFKRLVYSSCIIILLKTLQENSCSLFLFLNKSSMIAGSGQIGHVDGKPDTCSFNNPFGIVVHEPSHSRFVSDYGNNGTIKITFTDSLK